MKTRCDRCGDEVVRSEKHDSYLCKKCDEWLEEVCSDSECDFCPDRPDKPSECLDN